MFTTTGNGSPVTGQGNQNNDNQKEEFEKFLETYSDKVENLIKLRSEEAIKSKMVGQGTELKKLQSQLENLSAQKEAEVLKAVEEQKKKMFEEGKKDELIKILNSELDGFKNKYSTVERSMGEKIKELEENLTNMIQSRELAIKEVVKHWPKEIQALVPKTAKIEEKEEIIRNIQTNLLSNSNSNQEQNTGMFSGFAKPSRQKTTEQEQQDRLLKSYNKMMGIKEKAGV